MTELPGLSGATPIGFLAALGLIRVLADDRHHDVRLSWQGSQPRLHGLAAEAILDELVAHMVGRGDALEFTWADSPRGVSPVQYREAVARAQGDRRALAFLAGWGTDTVLRDGTISSTRWDMTSGQQKLLQDFRKLAPKVTREALEIALFGGPYTEQTSFGLDPVAVRFHAHEAKAPAKTAPPGKPGLVWLAFEAIPLHPVLPIGAGRAYTTGWRSGRDLGYVWPLWEAPLSLLEIALLRALPLQSLSRRPGVTQVWFSRYGMSGKYGMLLPAVRER